MANKTVAFGAVVVAYATAISGCADNTDNPTDTEDTRTVSGISECSKRLPGYYYIGENLPFSGDLSDMADYMEDSALLAVGEINAAGGVHGKSVGLVSCDTRLEPAAGTANMHELGGASPVSAVLGAVSSGVTIAASTAAKAAGKVQISPSSTSPAITDLDDGGYVFRVAASDAYQGRVAAKIADLAGHDRVFVIHLNQAYGEGLKDAFAAAFTGVGGATDSIAYLDEDLNYETTVIDAAVAFNPDAVFLVSYSDDAIAILNKAIERSFKPNWIFCDGNKTDNLFAGVTDPSYLEGIVGTAPGSPTGTQYAAFESAYREMWGKVPQVFAANTYDAIYLIAIAMELSDDPDDGTQVRDSLAQTHSGETIGPGEWSQFLAASSAGTVDYAGASGPVDFDANGDVASDFEEWRVEDGAIRTTRCWTAQAEDCN